MWIRVLCTMALLCPVLALAEMPQEGDFGGGASVGTVTELTGKYWFSKEDALDFGVGLIDYATATHVDYLWHLQDIFGRRTQFGRQTLLYFGGGGGLAAWTEQTCSHWSCTTSVGSAVFVRALSGIEWFPDRPHLGAFAEAGPLVALTPLPSTWISVSAGARFYF